ncbi:MAG TPA: hydantoinase/oxoprolinase family protein [Myxococcota bacterium]|nr:hydantoinase/oxoprolinase family protein [Myxococcota bacterium]
MSWRVGVDIGGTFTDLALQKDDALVVDKVLSTPADRSLAVMEGLEKLAAREGLTLRDFLGRLDALVHGTTVGDNTLIEGNGAVVGLLTTAGFRDELELRRGYKEDIWDVRLPAPPALVPRRRRLGVPERVRFDGSVHEPLDETAAREALRRLARQGVESLAVSLLFSFVNPAHERRLAELAAEELPGVPLSLSHEVMPKAPEFERTSTTVLNAYIGPRVTGYLDRLAERLRAAGFARELLVMQSSGGVMTRAYLRAAPVRILASGPAGGVIGGACVGVAKGEPNLLCVDMGGTSYDVSVVRGGAAPAQPGWNWHHRYVVGLPMVSVETLGAGGGSLCHVKAGTLAVGPESAGAEPGPVCYGRGGTRPTVTDAILVLGLLSEATEFAAGRLELTRRGVDAAFAEHVAGPLGCSVEEAAFDCWRVVNANMTQAVRRTTAERGVDPRELAMLAYGGNGPVFAAIQAQELGIRRVLVPKASPGFSALGALAARPALDEERSYLTPAGSADLARLRALFAELDGRGERYLAAAGHPRERVTMRYALNLRYPGQNWSLAIPVAERRGARDLAFVDEALAAEAVRRFHERHEAEYGHARRGEEPEITGVRLVAQGDVVAPRFAGGVGAPRREPAPYATRRANLGDGFKEAAIHRGRDLRPGDAIPSPAIIEETFTSVVVYPGWEARVDDAGDYLLERAY